MSKSILFADDNKNIREFCKRELEDEGYQVLLAGNGCEAVAAFRAHAPDLVILDVAMPMLDGMQVLEQIRAISLTTPVVFFTSYDESCVSDVRGRLATACVEKSGDLTELMRVVARALQRDKVHPPCHVGLAATPRSHTAQASG
jgi:two-component system, response regulator, stage 0 sporulation protein F